MHSFTSLNWQIIFYVLALLGCVFYLRRPRIEDKVKDQKVSWKPLEAICITLAIYYLTQIIGGLLAVIYPQLRGWHAQRSLDWLNNSVIGQFILVACIEVLTVWLLYIFLRRRRANFKTIGLKRPKWGDIGFVLIGFGAYFSLYIVATILAKKFIPEVNLNQSQQIGFSNAAGFQLIFVFISLVLLPPFVEELLVRGFLYSGLKNGLPKYAAVLVTSALFALAHLQAGSGAPLLWTAAIDTFVLSLVLIYLREKTGSLWASIGLHMLKNGIAFLALFVFVH